MTANGCYVYEDNMIIAIMRSPEAAKWLVETVKGWVKSEAAARIVRKERAARRYHRGE